MSTRSFAGLEGASSIRRGVFRLVPCVAPVSSVVRFAFQFGNSAVRQWLATMSDVTAETHSAEETIAFGRDLAKQLAPPKLVLLRGDLGAGKTTMVKGIAAAFAAAEQEDVTSPTFTLIHEYRG